MAGVDVGGGSGKRQVNQEINMIPFIDLLMVTIAFLLITAVWVSYSRIETDAQVPGQRQGPDPHTPSKDLHVYAKGDRFVLSWKQGATVLTEHSIPRPDTPSDRAPRYDDLADEIVQAYEREGGHRDASDHTLDRCVLHTDDDMRFAEMVAVMDAIYAAKREVVHSGQRKKVNAFALAFAAR